MKNTLEAQAELTDGRCLVGAVAQPKLPHRKGIFVAERPVIDDKQSRPLQQWMACFGKSMRPSDIKMGCASVVSVLHQLFDYRKAITIAISQVVANEVDVSIRARQEAKIRTHESASFYQSPQRQLRITKLHYCYVC